MILMMTHWLHLVTGRGRRLAAYATGELPEVDRASVEAALRTCPACQQEVEAYRLVSGTLRTSATATLTPDQAASFWSGVEQRIRRGATAHSRPARPAVRELFWDHPRLSLASAAAAVVLILGVTLGPMGLWDSRLPPGSSGVEVVSVEAGEGAPVMVFQAPGSSLKVIWVFEKPST